LDNYSGVARQNILLTTKYLRDAFASDDPVRRIAAKHVFAWMCLSPTDDKSVYKTYFHDLLPLDPRERYISSDDQRKVQLFVETLDSVTSGIDQEINDKKLTFSDSQVADAMVEATFRTFALVIDPESNMWSVNEFTLSAASYTAQGNVVRTSNHDLVFKPFSIGDIPVQSNTPINFLLDTHN
jgi:hypothetical protein